MPLIFCLDVMFVRCSDCSPCYDHHYNMKHWGGGGELFGYSRCVFMHLFSMFLYLLKNYNSLSFVKHPPSPQL